MPLLLNTHAVTLSLHVDESCLSVSQPDVHLDSILQSLCDAITLRV